MIGELITAGASLFGSIFGKKKQKVETTVDYVKMAQSAQAAGFNPLTALRNGGSAGFTTTTSPTISAIPEALGNLGGILGNALEKKLDPIEAKKRELDTALVDAQLRSLKQGPQVPGRFYQPRTYTGTKVSQQLVPRLGASSSKQAASVAGAMVNPVGYDVNQAQLTKFGSQGYWHNFPYLPDASAVEDSNGEVAGAVYGVAKVPVDGVYNAYRLASHLRKLSNEDRRKKTPSEWRPYSWVGPRVKRAVSDWFAPWTNPSIPGSSP